MILVTQCPVALVAELAKNRCPCVSRSCDQVRREVITWGTSSQHQAPSSYTSCLSVSAADFVFYFLRTGFIMFLGSMHVNKFPSTIMRSFSGATWFTDRPKMHYKYWLKLCHAFTSSFANKPQRLLRLHTKILPTCPVSLHSFSLRCSRPSCRSPHTLLP